MRKNSENSNIEEVGRKYPFHSPEGYFDAFPERLMSRIEIKNKSRKSVVSIRYLRPALGLVASIVIIFGLIFIPSILSSPEKIAEKQTEDIEYFLTCQFSALGIFESLGEPVVDDAFCGEQLEEVLIATVSEYDLIDLNSVK
jgi:hypothetical protein